MSKKSKKKNKSNKTGWIVFWIIMAIIVISLLFSLSGVLKKLSCRQVTEYRTERYWETEYRSNKNCDYDTDCECQHKSWLGLGSCDSCKCEVQKTRQVPYTVERCS